MRFSRERIQSQDLILDRNPYAALCLESGHSMRWLSDPLGHHDPAFTLRVDGHALPRETRNLGFAHFGRRRPQAAPLDTRLLDDIGEVIPKRVVTDPGGSGALSPPG